MPKAILSVHDKTGLVDFARGLVELGWTLLASGGTARLLRQSGLPVSTVSSILAMMELKGLVRQTSGMSYVVAREAQAVYKVE